MKRPEFGKTFYALSLAATVMAGAAACSRAMQGAPESAPASQGQTASLSPCGDGEHILTGIREVATGKDGGINAINTGGCADVINIRTQYVDGAIKSGEGFEFWCQLKLPGEFETSDGHGNATGEVITAITVPQQNPDLNRLPFCGQPSETI